MDDKQKINNSIGKAPKSQHRRSSGIGQFIQAVLLIVGRFFSKLYHSVVSGIKRCIAFFAGLLKNPSIRAESPGPRHARHAVYDLSDVIDPAEEMFKKQVSVTEDTTVLPGKHRIKPVYPVVDPAHLNPESREHTTIFKPREKRRNFFIGIVLTTMQLLFVVIFMMAAGGLGLVWGIAKAYMETTPTLDTEKIENQSVNSNIYDANGNLITIFTGTENREWATLAEIPKNLQNAFISVEDIRFRYHNGIDMKRLLGSFISNMMNESVQGGSTITQQLIKNRLLTMEQTYKRKIQEAYLAMQLEKTYTKDEILEAYLNTILLGGTNYGVKAAAKDYFNKDLSQLTLREMACLAGITQAPYKYNPRRAYYVTKDTGPLTERTNFVLKKMYEANFITKDEYEAALSDTLKVQEKSAVNKLYNYPYFVEYAINDVITHFLSQRNLQDTKANRTSIENEIRTGGYKIYTTLDPDIQKTVQDTLANYKNYPRTANSNDSIVKTSDGVEVIQPQAAAVVYDYQKGEIKAIVGGRNEPNTKKALNRAYQTSMPVGSSIKPLAVYAPAIDKGASPATVVANVPVKIDGWNTGKGYPATSSSSYGPVTLRKGLTSSLNIATARTLMDMVGIEDSKNYLVNLGVNPNHINADGPGLALGTSGITPVEMAVAYGAIANKGMYQEAYSFTKVEDKNGNVILDASKLRVKRQVFKESTAWMVTDMLKDAVRYGTGKQAKIPGMTVGGKTGTNQDNRGVFFAGITPYYAATVWIGQDNYKPLVGGIAASSTAAPLWQSFMSKIVKLKAATQKDRDIITDTPQSLGLVQATVCSVSGKLATAACKLDIDGDGPVKDWFLKGTVPTEECDWHYTVKIDKTTNLLATQYCPATAVIQRSVVIPPEQSALTQWGKLNKGLNIPPGTNIADLTPDNAEFASLFCNVHSETWYNQNYMRPQAVSAAKSEINAVQSKMAMYTLILSDDEKSTLNALISTLQGLITSTSSTAIQITSQTQELKDTANSIFAAHG